MKIKKFFKYTLVTSIPAGLVLLASFMPTINLSGQVSQTTQTTYDSTFQADSNVQVDSIDFAKVAKNNWTWPNDEYAKSDGYKLTYPNTRLHFSIFSLSKEGFIVDSGTNSYTRAYDYGIWPEDGEVMTPVNYARTETNLNVISQKYDKLTDKVKPVSVFSIPMVYGIEDQYFNQHVDKSQKLALELPYLQLDIPVVRYKIWCCRNDTDQLAEQQFELDPRTSLKTNNGNVQYPGTTTSGSEVRDERHQQYHAYSAFHFHSLMTIVKVKLSIYNDYDATGKLLGTHLLFQGNSFNSSLPALSVDESKLNKKNNVFRQDTNVSNLLTLSNAKSLPSLGGATVTVTKNAMAGEMIFNYKPNFIFNNGVLEKYTGAGIEQVVTGFSIFKTFITSKSGLENAIVVDRFINSIRKDGVIDNEELGKYLDLSSVPSGSSYTILDSSIKTDLVKGTIEFQINASNGLNFDGSLTNETTPYYTVGLQLAPRITKIRYTEFLDNILVTQYYNRVFDQTGLINLGEFNKYATIFASVDNAQYYLVPGSYSIDTGDGTVDFKIYASTYYGSDAQEKTGTEDDTTTHFNVNLTLNPLPSRVTEKTEHVPAHRVDKFIGLVANADGTVKDLTLLKEYVNFENIPTAATYAINLDSVQLDPFNADFYSEYVNFDLEIDKYNETSFISGVPKTVPLRVKLNKIHLETEVAAKTVTSPERVDRLIPKITNNQGIVTNRSLLEKYVDIKALPQRSVLSISNEVLDNSSGKLTFDLKASVAYGNDSNELINQVYPVELQLGIKHRPTTVTPVTNPVNPERVDRFAQVLKLLDSDGLKNYLVPHYLEIDGEFPIAENAVTYAVVNLTYQDEGTVKFDLIINAAYDSDSDPQINHTFPITLNLAKKFAPTKISAYSNYPRGSTISEFKALYAKYKDQQDELKTFLSHFLKGIDTIPDNAITSLNIDANKTDEVTGKLFFNVQTSTYYNESSDLINDAANPYVSNEIQLDLIPSDQQAMLTTKIDWKNDVSIGGKAQAFYALVNPNNKVDIEALSDYLELTNIPMDATITLENNDPNFKNALLLDFDIVLTYWWEAGTLKPEAGDVVQVKHFALKNNLYALNTSTKSLSFEWWWVALGIGGAVLLVTSYFLIKQYNEERKFKQRALGL